MCISSVKPCTSNITFIAVISLTTGKMVSVSCKSKEKEKEYSYNL